MTSSCYDKTKRSLRLLAAWVVVFLVAMAAIGVVAEAQTSATPPKMMAADADPSFDVATIKPNNSGVLIMQDLRIEGRRFVTRNSSLGDLIAFAYRVQVKQIVGAPDWLNQDRYDITGVPGGEDTPSMTQVGIMVQRLLEERFKLTFHHETREMPAYVLTIAKNGPKLTPPASPGPMPTIGFRPAPNGLTLLDLNGTVAAFASVLQIMVLDRPVVDQTGIAGRFDVQVTFTPDESEFKGQRMVPPTDAASAAPGLFDAVQQQLGLKLSAQKPQVDVISIDHVERPSPN
jgi:uncharacterized protein (TIGR03435 family)